MALRAGALVPARWLNQQLSSQVKQLAVLDTSTVIARNCHKEYLEKHIPGAQYYDLWKCVKPRQTCLFPLPAEECYQDQMRALGVSRDSHVVMYDSGAMYMASYAWWLMRSHGHESVSVLDGGLERWVAEGYGVRSGEEDTPKSGDFTVSVNTNLFCTLEEVQQQIEKGDRQIVDVRLPDNYHAVEAEPSAMTVEAMTALSLTPPKVMQGGHMPGSKNIQFPSFTNPETKCLLKPKQLKTLFESNNVDIMKPTTAVCYVGMTATLLSLSAHVLGNTDVKNYYGAWTEWGQLAKPEHCVKENPSRKSG